MNKISLRDSRYNIAQKMKFSVKDPQETVDLVAFTEEIVKGALSGLRQFLATENPLKIMKNDFFFILKAFFVFKIFKFLS